MDEKENVTGEQARSPTELTMQGAHVPPQMPELNANALKSKLDPSLTILAFDENADQVK